MKCPACGCEELSKESFLLPDARDIWLCCHCSQYVASKLPSGGRPLELVLVDENGHPLGNAGYLVKNKNP